MPDNETTAARCGIDDRSGVDRNRRLGERLSAAGPDTGAGAEDDDEADLDGCDVAVDEPTPDEDLPESTGGVA